MKTYRTTSRHKSLGDAEETTATESRLEGPGWGGEVEEPEERTTEGTGALGG